jgi:hypothetical protein
MNNLKWKNVRSYPLAAKMVAITAVLLLITLVVFTIFLLFATLHHGGSFGVGLGFLFFELPFAVLFVVNYALLLGILRRRISASVLATIVLPVEWVIGLNLGSNAISSGLFNGKQVIASLPHHTMWVVFAVLVLLSVATFGKEIRSTHTNSKQN